jgi:hypothetical protein
MHRFVPISFERFVTHYLNRNRGENPKRFRQSLEEAVRAKRAGKLCTCGNPIWAIGSAVVGYSCFTCITGQADASEDYEIDTAISPGGFPQDRSLVAKRDQRVDAGSAGRGDRNSERGDREHHASARE